MIKKKSMIILRRSSYPVRFYYPLINYVLEMARIESGKATLRTEVGDAQELLGALNAVF